MKKKHLLLVCTLIVTQLAFGQAQPAKQTPESTEIWSPVPRVVTPGNPPSDAIVLFNGKDLSGWKTAGDGSPAKWQAKDGVLTVQKGTGDILTEMTFDDFQLHIEFRTPAEVKGDGQGRGNSGIFLQGIYELQVLDNYNNRTYSNGQAGSIYKQTMPLVNACMKPGEWQTYDIAYTAPKFNKDGMMVIPPYVTVFQNNILVQNHTAIKGPTPYVGLPEIVPHGKGPLKLQDHGNPTSYRNIWVREI